jgi:hypothetical protein
LSDTTGDLEDRYIDLAELVAERAQRVRYIQALDADIARLVADPSLDDPQPTD